MSQEMISVQARHYQVTDEDIEYYESNNLMGPHLFCPDSTPQSTFDAYALKKAEREAKKGDYVEVGPFFTPCSPIDFQQSPLIGLDQEPTLTYPDSPSYNEGVSPPLKRKRNNDDDDDDEPLPKTRHIHLAIEKVIDGKQVFEININGKTILTRAM